VASQTAWTSPAPLAAQAEQFLPARLARQQFGFVYRPTLPQCLPHVRVRAVAAIGPQRVDRYPAHGGQHGTAQRPRLAAQFTLLRGQGVPLRLQRC
jgi:hypothetical protein